MLWKSEHSKTLLNIFLKPVSQLWRASAITGYQFTDGGLGFCEGGCVPNTAKLCSDAPANINVWRMMDCVLGEMELASLPCGSSQDSAACCAQTGMVSRIDMRHDQSLRASIQKPCYIWIDRLQNAHERRDPRFKNGARDLRSCPDADGTMFEIVGDSLEITGPCNRCDVGGARLPQDHAERQSPRRNLMFRLVRDKRHCTDLRERLSASFYRYAC